MALAAEAPPLDVHTAMLTRVNTQGLALWNITNKAIADDGSLDPGKLTTANWLQLGEIGKALQNAGRDLARAQKPMAAPPGAKLQSEDNAGSTAADVQRYLDARPIEFRRHALQLEHIGAGVVAAATRRDPKKLGDMANSLDGVCEGCHMIFWYPEQGKRK